MKKIAVLPRLRFALKYRNGKQRQGVPSPFDSVSFPIELTYQHKPQ